MKYLQRTLAFICFFLWSAAFVHTVSAHANLIRSSPTGSASLDESPEEIRLWFTEPLEPAYSRITLRASNGEIVEIVPSQIDADNPTQMFAALDSMILPDGLYTVGWRTVSAADGHATEGSFAFGIGGAVANLRTELTVNEAVAPEGVFVRWLNLLSLSLLVGSIGFDVFVWRPTRSAVSPRIRALTWLGWSAVGTASILLLLLQAGIASELPLMRVPAEMDLTAFITHSQFGQLWLVRMILWLLIGFALLHPLLRRQRRRLTWLAFLLCGVLLLTQSLFSHAAASADAAAATASDWLHLIATTLWIGGLVTFVLVLISIPGKRLELSETSRLVAAFSNYTRVLVAALVITGIYATWLQVGSVEALVNTVYGRALMIKILLFVPLLGIAAVNLLVTSRQLSNGNTIWIGRLRGLVASEIVLTMAILIAVGVLTSATPARGVQVVRDANTAASAHTQIVPYFGMEVTDELMTHLEIEPGTVGVNEFSVSLYTPDGTVIDDASLIRLRFIHQEQNLGESELRPTLQSDGIWMISGANLSIPGPWRIRMTVQRPAEFDTVLDFEVDVQAMPPSAAPVIDTTIPPVARSVAAILTGLGLLAVGGFFITRLEWRPMDGKALILIVTLVVGLIMLISGVTTAISTSRLSGELSAANAWSRPTRQGMTGSIYVQIENGTTSGQRLIGALTAVAERVELHQTEITDDVARMRPLEGIELPSGSTLEIAPVGYHLMLVELQQDLQAGDTFPLTLKFASGQQLEIEVQVQMNAPE